MSNPRISKDQIDAAAREAAENEGMPSGVPSGLPAELQNLLGSLLGGSRGEELPGEPTEFYTKGHDLLNAIIKANNENVDALDRWVKDIRATEPNPVVKLEAQAILARFDVSLFIFEKALSDIHQFVHMYDKYLRTGGEGGPFDITREDSVEMYGTVVLPPTTPKA